MGVKQRACREKKYSSTCQIDLSLTYQPEFSKCQHTVNSKIRIIIYWLGKMTILHRKNSMKEHLSEDGEIKYIKFDDYVSFMLGAKAENNELFKTFCNNAEMEQN